MKLTELFSKKQDGDEKIRLGQEAMQEMFGVVNFDRLDHILDEITMDIMLHIFREAKVGSLNRLIHVYQQMEHADSRLQGLINSRRNASAGMEFTVKATDDPRSVDASAFVEYCLTRLDLNTLIRDFLDGRFYGVAVFEKIWELSEYENRRVARIRSIQQVDHSALFMDMDSMDWRFGELYFQGLHDMTDRIYLADVNPRKLIVGVNTSKTGYHDLSGVMRTVARWSIIKTYSIKLWVQSAETHGHPTTIVKVNKKDFNAQKKQIVKLLRAVGLNRYGIFFDNMTYETHQSADAGSIAIFKDLVELCNTEMAIAVAGQNLSSEVKGGSFAAAESHKEILSDITHDDLKWITNLVNKYIVKDLVEVNFPDLPEEEYPEFSPYIKKQVNRTEVARGLNESSRLVAIPKKWVYDQLQIPVPEEGEDVITSDSRGLFDEIDRA